MIYQYIKKYLKNNFSSPTINFKWDKNKNSSFFKYIEQKYTINEFQKELHEVKQAFKDFFEPVGNIVFRYKDGVLNFKIFPYTVEPKYSIHLNNIVKIIQEHKEAISYPYNGQDNQIAILGKIRRRINFEIQDTKESINQKELIKYAIRIALKLSDRDVIVQLKRKYIVKIFDTNIIAKQKPQKIEGAKNRYNGYEEKEIEVTYNDIFSKTDIDTFLQTVMSSVFKTDLNFKIISYRYYEQNSLKIIHAQIIKELKNYISLEDDYIVGIAGFLMRKNFQEIHKKIALELMNCIYEKDKNAIDFLTYFDGKIVLQNNKKYQVPSILTNDGEKWNITMLINIYNLWLNTNKTKQCDEDKLTDIDSKIDSKKLSATEIEYLIKQKKKLQNNIKSENLSINLKMNQTTAIINSITKALMQKKQPV